MRSCWGGRNREAKHYGTGISYILGDASLCSSQFLARLSPTFTIANNMYFCIGPGSRSSPLSVAADSNPLTTCIACIDERSLAFHALGYAGSSQKPAVITSSGTAVRNLLPAEYTIFKPSCKMVVMIFDNLRTYFHHTMMPWMSVMKMIRMTVLQSLMRKMRNFSYSMCQLKTYCEILETKFVPIKQVEAVDIGQ